MDPRIAALYDHRCATAARVALAYLTNAERLAPVAHSDLVRYALDAARQSLDAAVVIANRRAQTSWDAVLHTEGFRAWWDEHGQDEPILVPPVDHRPSDEQE